MVFKEEVGEGSIGKSPALPKSNATSREGFCPHWYLMSALGQKQTLQHTPAMSALPPNSGHAGPRDYIRRPCFLSYVVYLG